MRPKPLWTSEPMTTNVSSNNPTGLHGRKRPWCESYPPHAVQAKRAQISGGAGTGINPGLLSLDSVPTGSGVLVSLRMCLAANYRPPDPNGVGGVVSLSHTALGREPWRLDLTWRATVLSRPGAAASVAAAGVPRR